MPALRPASQAGPMRNPREETNVYSVTWHHQANLMVCVVCICCATSPYKEVCRAKGGIGSGETLCHDIYPTRPITTVSLAANTAWWTALAPCAPRTVGPMVQFSGACEQSHWWPTSSHEAICYQWFKQRLILSVSKPSISQRSQIQEDTVEASVPAREFKLKSYAATTWHNDPASPGLEPRLADHRSQAARTATLPTTPPRQGHSAYQSRNRKFAERQTRDAKIAILF